MNASPASSGVAQTLRFAPRQSWSFAPHLIMVLAALAWLAPAPVLAQGTGTVLAQDASAPQPKEIGWWAGGGGGYLAGRADCSNCETELAYGNGGAFILQGGVRVRDRLHVGAEVYSTNRTLPGGSFRNTHLLAIFQYRPFAGLGWFLKGGYGMAIVKGAIPGPEGDATARTWGMGVMYGTGWEFKVGRHASFVPLAATYITTVGDVSTPNGTASNVVVNGWFAGALLTVR
jgi:hypothetical protein